jgi:hypothetical protein
MARVAAGRTLARPRRRLRVTTLVRIPPSRVRVRAVLAENCGIRRLPPSLLVAVSAPDSAFLGEYGTYADAAWWYTHQRRHTESPPWSGEGSTGGDARHRGSQLTSMAIRDKSIVKVLYSTVYAICFPVRRQQRKQTARRASLKTQLT